MCLVNSLRINVLISILPKANGHVIPNLNNLVRDVMMTRWVELQLSHDL